MEKTRIALYKKREFGDIFNVTFAFIKQEFKPLGKAILVFVLPFIFIHGIFMAIYQSSIYDMNPMTIDSNYLATIYIKMLPVLAIMLIVQAVIFSTVVSYLKLYNASENEITISALANEFKKHILPVIVTVLLTIILIVVGLVLCIIPGIYLGVSLSVFIIALIMEQKGIGNAFSRSFQLVQIQWWWTFLLLFVTLILMYIISFILTIPSMIVGFGSMFHNIKMHTNPFEAFGPLYIIYSVFIAVVQEILYIIPILLVAFQYFSLVEMREKSSLQEKINAIGQNE